MSAFKQFTTKDVVITPFNVNKGFNFVGSEVTGSDVGIEIYEGLKPSTNVFVSSSAKPTGLVYKSNTTGVYHNIKQLYYSNYVSSSSGDNVPTQSVVPGATREDDRYVGLIEAPRYNNFLQSDLQQYREFPTGSGGQISVVSIPAKLYGENIVPTTFRMYYTSSGGAPQYITDDGEGNLIDMLSGGYGDGTFYGTSSYGEEVFVNLTPDPEDIIGQIFYSHGIIVFTEGEMSQIGEEVSASLSNLDNVDISFSSSLRIYENQYKCLIRENEYGYSQNPSILSGSQDDQYYDFATGSYFNPYITTVGLYNENNELLVVGKLSQPVPVSSYTDTTIIVNFDL